MPSKVVLSIFAVSILVSGIGVGVFVVKNLNSTSFSTFEDRTGANVLPFQPQIDEVEPIAPYARANTSQIAVLEAQDRRYESDISQNTSVYDFMIKLQDTQDFQFSGRDFFGVGFFVEEINHVSENAQERIYWIFYVNDQKAKVGISSYIIKPNDIITWKYEKAYD